MKVLQMLATAALWIAGALLMIKPLRAQAPSPAIAAARPFVPTRFTVTDAGTVGKTDVLMIPGLSSSHTVWDGEAKLLKPNYRLHILQVGGFAGARAGGNATGPMLPGIVEELHQYIAANITPTATRPVVIGHSLGGLLALMLAKKYPADVAKLVIVDALPYYAVLFNPAATVENTKPQADAIAQQMLAMPDDQYAAMQPMMAAQLVLTPGGQNLVATSSAASDRKVVVEAMLEDLQTDLRADVAAIQTPTLMLYPYDPTTQGATPAKVDALYQGAYKPMPNVKLVRVDGSRHFIMYDQPAKLDAAVEAFLK